MNLPSALVVALTSLAASCTATPSPAPDAAPPDAAPDASDAASPDAASPDATPTPTCPTLPTPLPFAPHAAARHPQDDTLRLNHVQVKATHNSYHLQSPFAVTEWSYSHVPLAEQLATQGVRGVELDVHWEPRCGRFEVYHLGTLDPRTTCRVFTDCLLALRGFSASHAGHGPIFVHIEPKDPDENFDESRLVALEREVLAVFDRGWIITPDEVRGGATSLAAGLAAHGWPTLGAARGRLLFYIDNAAGVRELYTHGRRDLDGRLMFVDSDATDPFAAVRILNDPLASADAIAQALAAGQLVRTRADSDPAVAQSNDRAQLTAALASGAQIVSTDFPARTTGSEYVLDIPGGTPSRCSAITAPASCTSAAVEDPALLDR